MQTLYERSEDRLRTYWPAGTVDLLEGCQGVFQTFVDVRFQRLGGSVDCATSKCVKMECSDIFGNYISGQTDRSAEQ